MGERSGDGAGGLRSVSSDVNADVAAVSKQVHPSGVGVDDEKSSYLRDRLGKTRPPLYADII